MALHARVKFTRVFLAMLLAFGKDKVETTPRLTYVFLTFSVHFMCYELTLVCGIRLLSIIALWVRVKTQGLPEAQKLLTQIGEYLTIMRKTKQLGVVPTEEVSSPCGKIIYYYSLHITTVYNVCLFLIDCTCTVPKMVLSIQCYCALTSCLSVRRLSGHHGL